MWNPCESGLHSASSGISWGKPLIRSMKILDHVYLVGSGATGISDPGDCHVYLLDGGSELALVDAGCGINSVRILENIDRHGFDPSAVHALLITHAHRDHAGGCRSLKTALSGGNGLRLMASHAEGSLLAEGTLEELGLNRLGLGDRPRQETFPPVQIDQFLQDGQTLSIGNLKIKTIEVPGHNPGCMCYLVEVDGRRALFSGDVIYPGGVIGLGNWPGSDLHAYERGLQKLAGLKIDALFPGHLLWTIHGGQEHIDKALHAFQGLWPPPNINLIP